MDRRLYSHARPSLLAVLAVEDGDALLRRSLRPQDVRLARVEEQLVQCRVLEDVEGAL